jgi:hypothetical protein
MMTAFEDALRRELAADADTVRPSPDGLDRIRAATSKPRTRMPRLSFRRNAAKPRRNARA